MKSQFSITAFILLCLTFNGCDSSSSGHGGGNNAGQFPGFLIATNSGTADDQPFFNTALQSTGSLQTGANQGLDRLGVNVVQGSDLSQPELRIVANGATRQSTGTFSATTDVVLQLPGTDPVKGIAVVESHGLILVTRVNGRVNAGRVEGYSLNARNSAGTVSAVFQLTDFSLGNMPANSPVAATSPWDLFYDSANDRLFVALMNGFVAVYDAFLATNPASRSADRFFRPNDGSRNAINLHGIVVNENDQMILTDVGDVSSATDGRVFVVTGSFASISGDISNSTNNIGVQTIQGADTQLGNPVDVFLARDKTIIVEKSNGVAIVYNDLNSFGNRAPDSTVAATAPESGVFFNSGELKAVAVNDLDEAIPGFQIQQFLVSQNPDSTTGPEEGRIIAIAPNLSAIQSTFDFSVSGTPRSIENIFLDQYGSLHVTGSIAGDGSESAGTGQIASLTMIGRPAQRIGSASTIDANLDDASGITGAQALLDNPKGIDVDSQSGYRFVADFSSAAPAIYTFPLFVSGNQAPVIQTTDLGLAGRRPWDLDYDPVADRLFVACTDGFVVVYDNYLAIGLNSGTAPGPNRAFQVSYPTGSSLSMSTNFHGIIYRRTEDTLFLSDVGSAASGTDGLLTAVTSASNRNGTVDPVFTISGNATLLGNPVDIAVARNTIYVAEKSQNRVMAFPYLGLTGSNEFAASQSIVVEKPESIVIQTQDLFQIR